MQKVYIHSIRCGLQLSLMPAYVNVEMMKVDDLFTNQALQETRDTGRQGQHKYQRNNFFAAYNKQYAPNL